MEKLKTYSELIRLEAAEGNLSRAAFARRYNIPLRTLEEWDAGRRETSKWIIDLLARTVLEDTWGCIAPNFSVVEIGHKEERILLQTKSYTEAIDAARKARRETQESSSQEQQARRIEIRYGDIDIYNTLYF